MSEVQREAQRLEALIQYGMSRMQDLADRLGPVLRPLIPSDEKKPNSPQPQTAHANFLMDQANRVSVMNETLDSLLNRIEL